MGSKYARIAGITAGRPAVTINRPLVGAEGKSISHKNHLMEEFELWHFYKRSRNLTDTCYRSWSRTWNLGSNQPYGRIRNDNRATRS